MAKKQIFFIHGMWGTGAYWKNHADFFEKRGYQCSATTLRHHETAGGKPNPEVGALSLLDYAADLERELRAFREPPIVIGHSMGGLLTQMLAARGLASKAVCITTASPRGILALRLSVIRSFFTHFIRWGFWRKPYLQTFGEARYSMLHLLTPEKQRQVYETFVHESGRAAYEIGLWLLDPSRASEVDESRVTCPMLVIGAARDRITPASVVRRVARKYPQATYLEYPDHAHWIVDEPGWEKVAEDILTWIEGDHAGNG